MANYLRVLATEQVVRNLLEHRHLVKLLSAHSSVSQTLSKNNPGEVRRPDTRLADSKFTVNCVDFHRRPFTKGEFGGSTRGSRNRNGRG